MEKSNVGGYASVNGINMYYEVHGEGTPLVLIHGGGSSIYTSFGTLLPLLAKHYKVIAMDLQAHGHTSDRDAPESFEQDADDVIALLQYLGIARAHIMGFSNGGNTTMMVAHKAPQLVDRLVVISAFYKREGMIPGFFEGMGMATLEVMPKQLQDNYLQINNDPKGLQNMFEKDRNRMATFTDWSDDILRSIKAPTLVVVADRDVMTPEHTVQMSRLIPNSQLMILPGTHGSFIGEVCSILEGSRMPELFVEMVREFLG
jgi:pimeloyl-ACP methyl ester carboxylesterase